MTGTHKIYYVGAPIGSVTALAQTLGVTEGKLLNYATRAEKNYLIFFKSVKGKERELSEPYLDLKIIQKRILNRILCHVRFPHYLHGAVKAKDPRDFYSNARSHQQAETIISMDVKSFFPSITADLVEKTFTLLCHFPPAVAKILAKLTTLKGQLPQGAPTSSAISNLVMFEKEYKLASSMEAQGFVYSRLIDDIAISSAKRISQERITKIITAVAKMVTAYGFTIHPDKTTVRSRSNPKDLMTVTGLWLNRGQPKLAREKRIQISREVIQLNKIALAEGRIKDTYHTAYNSISGKVALLQRLNHTRALRLRGILESIVPVHDAQGVAKISILVERFCKKKHDPDSIGYIKKYYRLQNQISIVKRTHPIVARRLQNKINARRPVKTLRSHYE
jgi:retron-type reverse transcriptase